MNKLINAEKLLQELWEMHNNIFADNPFCDRETLVNEQNGIMKAIAAVEQQEIAYDVDAVVEEIKQECKDEVNAGMCPSGTVSCLTTISIVRNGGAE